MELRFHWDIFRVIITHHILWPNNHGLHIIRRVWPYTIHTLYVNVIYLVLFIKYNVTRITIKFYKCMLYIIKCSIWIDQMCAAHTLTHPVASCAKVVIYGQRMLRIIINITYTRYTYKCTLYSVHARTMCSIICRYVYRSFRNAYVFFFLSFFSKSFCVVHLCVLVRPYLNSKAIQYVSDTVMVVMVDKK